MANLRSGRANAYFYNFLCTGTRGRPGARSIRPKFPEILVQNSMDRFGPTGKVSKKLVHLLRWSSLPGRTGWLNGSRPREKSKVISGGTSLNLLAEERVCGLHIGEFKINDATAASMPQNLHT